MTQNLALVENRNTVIFRLTLLWLIELGVTQFQFFHANNLLLPCCAHPLIFLLFELTITVYRYVFCTLYAQLHDYNLANLLLVLVHVYICPQLSQLGLAFIVSTQQCRSNKIKVISTLGKKINIGKRYCWNVSVTTTARIITVLTEPRLPQNLLSTVFVFCINPALQ